MLLQVVKDNWTLPIQFLLHLLVALLLHKKSYKIFFCNIVANPIFATILHLFMRNTAKKIIAFLLLFLFIEKSGLRLWIHTHYHLSATTQPLSTSDTITHESVSEKCCDCLDDFFIPLTYTDKISLSILPAQYCEIFYVHYKDSISGFSTFSAQLRGPPIC